MSVTKFGVSAENVVATIEIPNNHQGILRPDKKNSLALLPDFFETTIPMIAKTIKKEIMIIQSKVDNDI
ncbi:hypothetical protein GCM10009430_25390 [Aquimarina litoralis]|uniref:Uncharacterized protein n=1 Tax=Aquimarina litoralis TaxID=584605 RepID=A0ABN1IWL1_9FLAO